MKRFTIAAVLAVVFLGLHIHGRAQTVPTTTDLRQQLAARYEIVALQQGVALVPRAPDATYRLIQIVNGVITVDGQTLTGGELRTRLGQDADAVTRVSYLDAPGQRELAGAAAQAPAPAAAAQPPVETPRREQTRRGAIVRFGESVTVGRDERVDGDVVALGGSVTVDGEVTGEVAAIGGSVTLGPTARVGGDIAVVGGSLRRSPGAVVEGDIEEVGRGTGGRFGRRGWRFGDVFGTFWSRMGSLAATALRLCLLALLGVVAVAFGRTQLEGIGASASASPLRAGLVGLLGQVLFVPVLVLTVVVLAVSIIGIPLLVLVPFGILLFVLMMLAGFLGLAFQVGQAVTRRFGWEGRGAFAAVAFGVVAIGFLTLTAKLIALAGGGVVGIPIAILGYALEYVAWTVGFGAAILTWHQSQTARRARKHTPEPPPAPPVTPIPGEA